MAHANRRLTYGEQRVLARRTIGITQERMARQLRMTVKKYRAEERRTDYRKAPEGFTWGGLCDHDRCFILRRRSTLTQVQVAKALLVSRVWVNLMERGKVPCGMLTEYWNADI